MDLRIGPGTDVHALGEGLPMWLCGVRVPSDKGFIAHSDGDVAVHALCDALLGALALGDIGHHFPDTDPTYKGINSMELLRRVMELIRKQGYSVSNADITIQLQSPKVGHLVPAMRESLAEGLGIDLSRVSVKATTTEKLGFVGRCEGCRVDAVTLLYK